MKLWKLALIVCVLVAVGSTATAVPILQLYVEGGTYDPVLESWVVTGPDAKLWVLGNVDGPGGAGQISNVYLVASVYGTIGTLVLTGTTTSLVTDPSNPGDPTYVGTSSPIDIPEGVENHEEYSSADAHLFYSIGDFTLLDSPVADLINYFPSYPGSAWSENAGQLNVYSVTVSGYSVVHFDAYDTVAGQTHAKVVFAPFSHDASVVPEPTALCLLGAGLAGIAFIRRRRR